MQEMLQGGQIEPSDITWASPAGLLELSGRQWVNKLSRDQAITAAVHLQRDVGLMQTNVDVLDQYVLALQKAASRIIDNCLGPCVYPAAEIATGALGRVVREIPGRYFPGGISRYFPPCPIPPREIPGNTFYYNNSIIFQVNRKL